MSASLFGVEPRQDEMFRARVAMHLAPTWLKRANALKVCGSAGVKLRCECGDACLVPYHCGSRACPACARIVAAQKTARVANRVRIALESRWNDDVWDGQGKPRLVGWKLFTGTSRAGLPSMRYRPDVLAERITKVRKAWGPFWRSTAWGARVNRDRTDVDGVVIGRSRRARRDTAAIMGIEVAPGGMVHLHAAIRGEWIESAELQALWSAALGEPAFIKIRAIRATTPGDFEKALREVLKYVTKWDKAPGDREQRAAAIETAMRGVRRVELAGALRSMPGADESAAHADPDICTSCGRSSWRWVSIWEPEKVAANGGFGRVTAVLDDIERRAFRRNPARGYIEHLAREHSDIVSEPTDSAGAAPDFVA